MWDQRQLPVVFVVSVSLITKSNSESCEFRPLILEQQFHRLERCQTDKLTNRKRFPCASPGDGSVHAACVCVYLTCTHSRITQIPPYGIPSMVFAQRAKEGVSIGVCRKTPACASCELIVPFRSNRIKPAGGVGPSSLGHKLIKAAAFPCGAAAPPGTLKIDWRS